ncbi:MAG: family 1 glycosylhydrolase, partial [Candidatus Gribaldobacteria bacterium]|nr:family 1 glycosylhydrolase [Candidatus Gribaldobacteria bacterium]
MNKRVFPEGFLWGVATAAHQVEGDNYNDFSEWEKMGRCKDISGSACNHWDLEQFKKDIDLLQKLGSNAYRMSIEWSRIMPRIDVINHSVIEHYRKMLSILKSAAMSPKVTLHHFTNPVWFGNIGGWDCGSLNPFYKYVDEATNALADQVDYWCTINEPLIFIACAYIAGIRPPGEKGRLAKA